jgi:hypothetical protein
MVAASETTESLRGGRRRRDCLLWRGRREKVLASWERVRDMKVGREGRTRWSAASEACSLHTVRVS